MEGDWEVGILMDRLRRVDAFVGAFVDAFVGKDTLGHRRDECNDEASDRVVRIMDVVRHSIVVGVIVQYTMC